MAINNNSKILPPPDPPGLIKWLRENLGPTQIAPKTNHKKLVINLPKGLL